MRFTGERSGRGVAARGVGRGRRVGGGVRRRGLSYRLGALATVAVWWPKKRIPSQAMIATTTAATAKGANERRGGSISYDGGSRSTTARMVSRPPGSLELTGCAPTAAAARTPGATMPAGSAAAVLGGPPASAAAPNALPADPTRGDAADAYATAALLARSIASGPAWLRRSTLGAKLSRVRQVRRPHAPPAIQAVPVASRRRPLPRPRRGELGWRSQRTISPRLQTRRRRPIHRPAAKALSGS